MCGSALRERFGALDDPGRFFFFKNPMPNALLKFAYDAPVPSVLTLVVGNQLRVKLESIDKRQKLVAVSDIPNLLQVTTFFMHSRTG